MASVPIRDRRWVRHRDTKSRPHKDGAEIGVRSPKPGYTRISGNYQKLGKGHENLLPQSFQGTHLCHKLVLIFVK